MTKIQAQIAICCRLSSGTLARLIGDPRYSVIDEALTQWMERVDLLPDDHFAACETWGDVLEVAPLR